MTAIKQFKEIQKLAVFNNFVWDTYVRDKVGNVINMNDINIFYGRNYSGKTTISRILRAFETGVLSSKYKEPKFSISLSDNTELTETDILNNSLNIRVFNEDFVNDNLNFIINSDKDITAFAILGEENSKLESEIKELKKDIGEDDNTGLTLKLSEQLNSTTQAKDVYVKSQQTLTKELETKATDPKLGIKYNSEKFGDQNYNITKLKQDIEVVKSDKFVPADKTKIESIEQTIVESELPSIGNLSISNAFNLKNLLEKGKVIIEKEIVKTETIEELLEDKIKNNWVKQGFELHQHSHEKCVFCNNNIPLDRWKKLALHFNEESRSLEKDIEDLQKEIQNEITLVGKADLPDINIFYKKFHNEYELIKKKYNDDLAEYLNTLKELNTQLQGKKDDLYTKQTFNIYKDVTSKLHGNISDIRTLATKSDSYSEALSKDKKEAKDKLRLQEVFSFISYTKYDEQLTNISDNKKKHEDEDAKLKEIEKEIKDKQELIIKKQNLMKDEGNGANKVNEYLNHLLGYPYISLVPVESEENKKTIFEVRRNNEKAYHLSNGEKSLLAFCYFIAKLHDTNTKGTEPIVVIDDPISSLDSNHIFFIFSLISGELIEKCAFSQLIITTHNLNFLKYLKRIPTKVLLPNGDEKNFSKCHFILERLDRNTYIKQMPDYLKNNVTEFNYLFNQIFTCAQVQSVTDENYVIFYNFGNNARKFLELYLSYKYPDGEEYRESNDIKLEKFFGKDKIPALFTTRINNEYSHLISIFERGAQPVEEPEMKKVAELIRSTIELKDPEQYASLLKSISQ